MKEVKIEDMIENKNYLAVVTIAKETYFHTVSLLDGVGLFEYKPDTECETCEAGCGDKWESAEWMIDGYNLKIYEL